MCVCLCDSDACLGHDVAAGSAVSPILIHM